MTSALQDSPPKIHLDILMSPDGEGLWVAHCLQLDLVTAGTDPDAVMEDARNICGAQIAFALGNGLVGNLFRPSNPDLYQKLLDAKGSGVVVVDMTVAKKTLEIQEVRLAA